MEEETLTPVGREMEGSRAEIDTSAPFESVKEAVDRFGGSAVWSSQLKALFHPQTPTEVDIMIVEEQTAELEKDLIAKENETLNILKDLEMTKRIVDDLKLKLHKEAPEVVKVPDIKSAGAKVHPLVGTEGVEKQSPSSILAKLQQAKKNLNRTTSDLAGIRSSIDALKADIDKETSLLEKTRANLAAKNAAVSSLQEELNQTALKLEISKLTAEIEQVKASTKTSEVRLLAARKMEEAARAAEAVAIAEIKALTTTEHEASTAVTLSVEEYNELKRKADEADEMSRKKVEAAMALEEALIRVESANRAKLAVEEALRKWRSDGQKRRHIHDAPRFKTSHPGTNRRESRLLDVNGQNIVTVAQRSRLNHTLSIGEILSRKLVGPEEDYDVGLHEKLDAKPKVSLGQMLSKKQGVDVDSGSARKKLTAKRKKMGFASISLKSKNGKKTSARKLSNDSSVAVEC